MGEIEFHKFASQKVFGPEKKQPHPLMGGNTSQQAVVNGINSMVADVFINIALFCNSNSTSQQTVNIKCQPYTDSATIIWELNPGCQKCIQGIVDAQLRYYKFQQDLWANRAPSVQGSIDTDYQNVISEFINCGSTACKACSVQNVSQNTVIQTVLNCAAVNNIQNTLNQQLTAQITQNLTNNQDLLSPLATMLGASTTNSMITNLTNRIEALITTNVIADITQQISNNQVLNITGSGGSLNVNGSTQDSAFNSIMTYLGTNNIFNNVFQQAQWDVLQDLINEQSTIDTLGNLIPKSVGDLEKLVSNIVGQIVLAVLGMIFGVFLIEFFYMLDRVIQKAIQKKQTKDSELKRQADKVPIFEAF